MPVYIKTRVNTLAVSYRGIFGMIQGLKQDLDSSNSSSDNDHRYIFVCLGGFVRFVLFV